MGDSAYGSAEMLGWLVHEHGIEPHVTVFDKSARQDGTFSRDDFAYDQRRCRSGSTRGSRTRQRIHQERREAHGRCMRYAECLRG